MQSLADDLDQLMAASRELSKKDPIRAVYELAWYSMSEYESGNTGLATKQLADVLMDPQIATEEFLYDYRNAVGTMLGLFLTHKVGNWDTFAELQNRTLEIVKKWRWHDYTGEVIFAYSLLLGVLSPSSPELKEIASMCLSQTEEAMNNNSSLLDNAKDVSWKILTLTYFDKKIRSEVSDFLKDRKAVLNQLVSAQIEVLAPLLWAFTSFDHQEFSDLEEKIAKNLLSQIRELKDSSLDPDFFQRFVNAIGLAKEGLVDQAKQTLKLVEDYSDNRLTVDLATVNIGIPRLSVLAKSKIALVKSGFYKPFMLSSRQEDVYEQIQTADKTGLKYLRKYEFAAGLIGGGLLLLFGLYALARTFDFNWLSSIATLILVLGTYSDLAWGVWKEGALTKHSILRAARRIGVCNRSKVGDLICV